MAMAETSPATPEMMQTQSPSVVDTITHWAGRSFLRAAGAEAGFEAWRHLTSKGVPGFLALPQAVGAQLLSYPFPATMALRQSRWGQIPFLGGLAQLGLAFFVDLPADTAGLIPGIGHGSRIGYQFLAAGVGEMLPKRRGDMPSNALPTRRGMP